MVHELAEVRVGFEDRRRLSSVNESSGKLACMIHTKLSMRVRRDTHLGLEGKQWMKRQAYGAV
jgi:hypothetical protein